MKRLFEAMITVANENVEQMNEHSLDDCGPALVFEKEDIRNMLIELTALLLYAKKHCRGGKVVLNASSLYGLTQFTGIMKAAKNLEAIRESIYGSKKEFVNDGHLSSSIISVIYGLIQGNVMLSEKIPELKEFRTTIRNAILAETRKTDKEEKAT